MPEEGIQRGWEKIRELHLNPVHYYDYIPMPGQIPAQLLPILLLGKAPLDIAGRMQRTIDAESDALYYKLPDYDRIFKDWLHLSFDAANPVLYHPNGKVKLVSNTHRQYCLDIIPTGEIKDGSIVLPPGFYGAMEGLELSKREAARQNDKALTRYSALKSKVWQFFAQDSDRLAAFVELAFNKISLKAGDGKGMAVYFAPPPQIPSMRLSYFEGVGSNVYVDASTDIEDWQGMIIAADKRTLEHLLKKVNTSSPKAAPSAFEPEFSRFF